MSSRRRWQKRSHRLCSSHDRTWGRISGTYRKTRKAHEVTFTDVGDTVEKVNLVVLTLTLQMRRTQKLTKKRSNLISSDAARVTKEHQFKARSDIPVPVLNISAAPNVEQLRKRTRCFRCRHVGHFSKGCPDKLRSKPARQSRELIACDEHSS